MRNMNAYGSVHSANVSQKLHQYLAKNSGPWIINFFATDDGFSAMQKNYGLSAFIVDGMEIRNGCYSFFNRDNTVVVSLNAEAVVNPVLTKVEGADILWLEYLSALVPEQIAPSGHQKYHPWKITLEPYVPEQ